MFWFGWLVFVFAPIAILVELVRSAYLEYRRDRIPILLYHRLALRSGDTSAADPIYTCYQDNFADQMTYLRDAGYAALTLDDYESIRAGRLPRPPKPVILTFDDGYLSFYTLGWPILQSNGLCATLFVPPHPDEESREFVRGIDDFMTIDQLQAVDATGIRIESHTLTHAVLANLNDSEAKYELQESKRVLEHMMHRPIRHLAIPRAGYSRRIRRLTIEAGYETVCCNRKGTSTGLSDLFGLPRIVIERDMTLEEFANALRPIHAIRLRLLGNLKRVPEWLLGPRFASTMRKWLLASSLGILLPTRSLQRCVIAAATAYVFVCGVFIWYWLSPHIR